MKKVFVVALVLFIFLSFNVWAAGNALLDMRNKIFKESKDIKNLLTKSKDVYLINNMWDSCVLSMTQLDAYFSMIGIYNTIRKENLTQATVDYLTGWLGEIKKTNTINIKSLSSVADTIEGETKTQMDILKRYYAELNDRMDSEINKLSLLKRTLRR